MGGLNGGPPEPYCNSSAQKVILTTHLTSRTYLKTSEMSDGKHRKRDRLREILSPGRPKPPVEKQNGPYTPTVASSATSMQSGVAGPNEAATPSITAPPFSTQHILTPIEPTGGAIGDATFKSNPTSQPRPTSAASAAHTQVENKGEFISAAAHSTQAQSLWNRAFNSDRLSLQERKTLVDTGPGYDSQETVSAVKSNLNEILNKKKGKQWKVKIRGEEVVLRDVGMKILHWADRFKQIGDIIVQYDPAHAAIPWAGFRFLLQVYFNR